MLYVKMQKETGEEFYAIGDPIYVRKQRNGVMIRWGSPTLAQGIVAPDGAALWQLEGKESLGQGFPVVQIVTMAEYDEWKSLQQMPQEPDPEDTEPEIPEDMEPETVLTRAELTEKVKWLEEELAAAKAALGLGESP